MDITPIIPANKKIITAYDSNNFTVSGEKYFSNIIIFADMVIPWKITHDLNHIDNYLVLNEFASQIEILLIGTGSKHIILEKSLLLQLKSNFNVEVMNSGAACRTYNILLAEGRNVAAALAILDTIKS
jgi:uncharacterized protein